MPTNTPTIEQLLKLRSIAKSHPAMTFALTSDGLIVARWLTPWLRDGYRAVVRGEVHIIEGRPDLEPLCYVVGRHGRILGYCKERPSAGREASLCGTPELPVPPAARRLTFRPYDAASVAKMLAAAQKRERSSAKAKAKAKSKAPAELATA